MTDAQRVFRILREAVTTEDDEKARAMSMRALLELSEVLTSNPIGESND